MRVCLAAPLWAALVYVPCCGADSATAEQRPALSSEELLQPDMCKDCHPKHYEEWSASMHAYASHDPVFIAMNRRAQEETNGDLGDFCVKCHAPMAVNKQAFTGEGISKFADVDKLPTHLQGVTCYFCHNAVGVGASHNNGNLTLANDDVMRAALEYATEPTTHKVAFSSFHDSASADSSLLCGSCHDILTPRGVHLERTYEEYAQSIYSLPGLPFQSCQTCHMAPVGDKQIVAQQTGRPGQLTSLKQFHSHMWPAVDLPLTDWPHSDAMRSAVEDCTFKRLDAFPYITLGLMPGPLGTLTVALETEAGHNFPSGASQDRRLWIEVFGYDATGAELYRLGVIEDGAVEEAGEARHPCLFRDYMLDENGEETHDFHEAASLSDSGRYLPYKAKGSQCLAPECHAQQCSFRPPLSAAIDPAERVEVRVRVRPMGLDVLNDLVSTGHLAADVPARMETLTVISATFVYRPESHSYEENLDLRSEEDCELWQCLMYPQDPACAAAAH